MKEDGKMSTPKVFESEYRFCLIMWENEPMTMSDLAKVCKEKIGWSRTTTYTVIKRLEERGILRKDGSTVVPVYTKEQIQTDGHRHGSTEESSARFATRLIGHSLRRWVVNRPACK